MPWKERHVMDERFRFVARLLEGEKMAPLYAELGASARAAMSPITRAAAWMLLRGASRLAEVVCKCETRAGFQISLEIDRPLFVGELHQNVKSPWSTGRRVRATPAVVRHKPCLYVKCQTSGSQLTQRRYGGHPSRPADVSSP